MKINYNLIEDVEVDGVDFQDYPDFVDAFISSAIHNGKPMTDEMLDELNEDHDFVYESVTNSIF